MAPNAKRWVEIKPKVGNLPMSVKDAEDQFVKIFHGNGAQLVNDSSDFHSIIGVGIASILGRDQQPISLLTVLVQFWRGVMAIPQNETDFCEHFSQETRSRVTVCHVGGGQHRREREPDGTDHRDDVQFPTVDESTASPLWSNGLG